MFLACFLDWVFCLLLRAYPLKLSLRLFDTYMSIEAGFAILHIYVCVALLLKWSSTIKAMDFCGIWKFL